MLTRTWNGDGTSYPPSKRRSGKGCVPAPTTDNNTRALQKTSTRFLINGPHLPGHLPASILQRPALRRALRRTAFDLGPGPIVELVVPRRRRHRRHRRRVDGIEFRLVPKHRGRCSLVVVVATVLRWRGAVQGRSRALLERPPGLLLSLGGHAAPALLLLLPHADERPDEQCG